MTNRQKHITFDLIPEMGHKVLNADYANDGIPNGEIIELIYWDGNLSKVTVRFRDNQKVSFDSDEFYAYFYGNGGYWVCGT